MMRRWPTRPGHPNFSSRPLAHPAVHAQVHTNLPVPCLKTRKKGRCSCDPRGSSEQKPPNASGTTSNGQASGGRSANRWSMSRRCTGRLHQNLPCTVCLSFVFLLERKVVTLMRAAVSVNQITHSDTLWRTARAPTTMCDERARGRREWVGRRRLRPASAERARGGWIGDRSHNVLVRFR
jgi:hypothetical protein